MPLNSEARPTRTRRSRASRPTRPASPDSSPGRGSRCREPKNSGRATCFYHCSSKISELG